jgi:trimeric autotransporter adhesin
MRIKNMKTLPLKNSTNRAPLRRVFLLIPLVLASIALWPTPNAFGVTPAPDGGYPGFNTAEGSGALASLTSGQNNTANGAGALQSNTTGPQNTATGSGALLHNTTGGLNVANGYGALFMNTTGVNNTANGAGALEFNTTGKFNVANGDGALQSNTTGTQNSANGGAALLSNTTGNFNTATGDQALNKNTTASNNTATGFEALFSNTTGTVNTATGASALLKNTTGTNNTATGVNALVNNTAGGNNIALGFLAGQNLTTGSNNIDIGNQGVATEANTIRVGTVGTQTKTFIAGVHGATASGGAAVFVNSSGQLGTLTSSARFKEDIKRMDKASEAILTLQPVTFRYKHEVDPEGILQFGLVAEQVEMVNPDLVARDEKGQVYTVRYEAVNAMLLNEFLKEHGKVQSLEAKLAQQQTQIEALTAGLQKVSAAVELNKAASTQVADNR